MEQVLQLASSNQVKYPVGLTLGVTIEQIMEVEARLGVVFPTDVVDFYLLTDGVDGLDDLFNILPLHELSARRLPEGTWVEFSEYMIFAESCGFVPNVNDLKSYTLLRGSGYQDPEDDYRPLKCSNLIDLIGTYSTGSAYEIWA